MNSNNTNEFIKYITDGNSLPTKETNDLFLDGTSVKNWWIEKASVFKDIIMRKISLILEEQKLEVLESLHINNRLPNEIDLFEDGENMLAWWTKYTCLISNSTDMISIDIIKKIDQIEISYVGSKQGRQK